MGDRWVDKALLRYVHELLCVGRPVVQRVVGFVEYGMAGRFDLVGRGVLELYSTVYSCVSEENNGGSVCGVDFVEADAGLLDCRMTTENTEMG